MKDYIITVMAQDRVGIVSAVSRAITDIQGNITHLSQTVMRNYFTLIISAEMPVELTLLEIKQAVERSGAMGEFEVNVRPYLSEPTTLPTSVERFTLSAQGADRPGIIAGITSHLLKRNINVEDLYSYVHDGKLLMFVQVAVPASVDVEEVQAGLERAGGEFGMMVHLQHENIFRATNEIQPVIGLRKAEI